MDYEEFEKAVDTLGVLSRLSKKDLKQKYLKLSKRYHPDMPEGSAQKFLEIKEAIQEAYYLNAMNPSDASTLIKLAEQIGMDKNKFEEDLKSEKIEEDLENELDFRRSIKVRSFPSLILKYKKEIYPINIQFGDYTQMLKQIENMTENTYF